MADDRRTQGCRRVAGALVTTIDGGIGVAAGAPESTGIASSLFAPPAAFGDLVRAGLARR